MRIKKFTASTLSEGKALILAELGDDAIILSSRTVKKQGDSGEGFVEIVAALDETAPVAAKSRPVQDESSQHRQSQGRTASKPDEGTPQSFPDGEKIYGELVTLKRIVSEISDSVRYKNLGSLGENLGKLYKALIQADIPEELAIQTVGEISQSGETDDLKKITDKAANLLIEHIQIAAPLKKGSATTIAAFVGPTGCGKTVTLVKLGIVCKLVLESKVLIVSADTRKVGGNEQLQTYASIAGIPFALAYTPIELNEIIDKNADTDFILIDTTGVSHKNTDGIEENKSFLKRVKPDFVYLVLSVTASGAALKDNIKSFSVFDPTSIILTKFDEAGAVGGLISVLRQNIIPASYFTTGQKIPEDMEPASKEKLAKYVFPDSINFEN